MSGCAGHRAWRCHPNPGDGAGHPRGVAERGNWAGVVPTEAWPRAVLHRCHPRHLGWLSRGLHRDDVAAAHWVWRRASEAASAPLEPRACACQACRGGLAVPGGCRRCSAHPHRVGWACPPIRLGGERASRACRPDQPGWERELRGGWACQGAGLGEDGRTGSSGGCRRLAGLVRSEGVRPVVGGDRRRDGWGLEHPDVAVRPMAATPVAQDGGLGPGRWGLVVCAPGVHHRRRRVPSPRWWELPAAQGRERQACWGRRRRAWR